MAILARPADVKFPVDSRSDIALAEVCRSRRITLAFQGRWQWPILPDVDYVVLSGRDSEAVSGEADDTHENPSAVTLYLTSLNRSDERGC